MADCNDDVSFRCMPDIYPYTLGRGGLLVRVPSDELVQFLRFIPSESHPHLLKMKALALIELLYRDRIRTREAYEAAWVVFHGDAVPPPDVLEAPSEMNPLSRDWIKHHVPAREVPLVDEGQVH